MYSEFQLYYPRDPEKGYANCNFSASGLASYVGIHFEMSGMFEIKSIERGGIFAPDSLFRKLAIRQEIEVLKEPLYEDYPISLLVQSIFNDETRELKVFLNGTMCATVIVPRGAKVAIIDPNFNKVQFLKDISHTTTHNSIFLGI